MSSEKAKCPDCGSDRACRDGSKYTPSGKIQRYLCKDCGRRFPAKLAAETQDQRKIIFVAHSNHPGINCPRCGNERIWKDGCYYPPFEEEIKVQRYFCIKCELRFSVREPNYP
ncbi:IS1 family transposase [Candidatus Bathyarchaeota archaeon]|nr:IS1 family transposase [Candidatus Bathyarchaeota archaeon]